MSPVVPFTPKPRETIPTLTPETGPGLTIRITQEPVRPDPSKPPATVTPLTPRKM